MNKVGPSGTRREKSSPGVRGGKPSSGARGEKSPPGARREKSDVTRRRLIEATIEAVGANGFANTTVATVARISGLSPGLVGFHFRSKNQLVRESLAYLIEQWIDGWRQIVANPRMAPHERVRAILDREFSTAWCNQRTVAIWYGYWGGVPTQPIHRQMCRDAERLQTLVLAEQFRLLIGQGGYADIDTDAAARGLSALMMGMYLSYGFDPEDFDRQSAKKICLSYLAGMFPKHFAQAWTRKPAAARGAPTAGGKEAVERKEVERKAAGRGATERGAVRWGVAAEYGRLLAALVSAPADAIAAVVPQVSQPVFMRQSLRSVEALRAEHEKLCGALVGAGVDLHRLPADPDNPLGCCIQDFGVITSFGAIVCPDAHPGAGPDDGRGAAVGPAALIRFYRDAGIPLFGTVSAGPYLAANIVAVRPGTVLLACAAAADSYLAIAQISEWFDPHGWEVGTILLPRPVERVDAILRIVSERHVLVVQALAGTEIADWLEQHGFEPVWLASDAELQATSILPLGDDRVLVTGQAPALNRQLRDAGLDVVEVDLPAFACHGIGLRQLVQPLRRESDRQ